MSSDFKIDLLSRALSKLELSLFLALIFTFSTYAQEEPFEGQRMDSISKDLTEKSAENQFSGIVVEDYDPLGPSRAGFYSAIFPGGGQIYNKKYWKVPLVWGALATSTYFYIDNNKQYKAYRESYKLFKLGLPVPEEPNTAGWTSDTYENAQEFYKRNADISLLITVGLYALQILEASVNAHLMQFNMDSNISFNPVIQTDMLSGRNNFGLGLTYTLDR